MALFTPFQEVVARRKAYMEVWQAWYGAARSRPWWLWENGDSAISMMFIGVVVPAAFAGLNSLAPASSWYTPLAVITTLVTWAMLPLFQVHVVERLNRPFDEHRRAQPNALAAHTTLPVEEFERLNWKLNNTGVSLIQQKDTWILHAKWQVEDDELDAFLEVVGSTDQRCSVEFKAEQQLYMLPVTCLFQDRKLVGVELSHDARLIQARDLSATDRQACQDLFELIRKQEQALFSPQIDLVAAE